MYVNRSHNLSLENSHCRLIRCCHCSCLRIIKPDGNDVGLVEFGSQAANAVTVGLMAVDTSSCLRSLPDPYASHPYPVLNRPYVINVIL